MLRAIKFAFACSFLLLIVVATTAAQETKSKYVPVQIDMGSGDFINDKSVYDRLSKIGKEFLKDDSLLKSSEILEQLEKIDSSIKLQLTDASEQKSRERSFDSTVVIGFLYDCGKCDKKHMGVATGVVISSDGLILTNNHVLQRGANFIHYVMTRDGKVFPVEKVLARHEANDIALIKIAATDLTFSSVASTVPQPLDDLYTISHPEMNFYYASTGQVARYVEREKDSVKTRWLQIDGEFSGGSSGGPVFDAKGNVIGLMTKQIPKLAKDGGHLRIMFHECVPVQVINDFVSGKLANVDPLAAFKLTLESANDKKTAKIYSELVKEQRTKTSAFYRSRRDAAKNKDIDMAQLQQTFNSDMQLVNKKMVLLTKVESESVSIDAYASILGSNDYKEDKSAVVQQLLKRHLNSPKLTGKLESLCRGMLTPTTTLMLENIATNSKSEASQGAAKYLLATLTKSTSEYYAKLLKNAAYKKSKPKDLDFQQSIAKTSLDEITDQLKLVKEEYGSVKFKNSTLDKLVTKELKKLEWSKNLQVGKVAPEIEGPDLDGKTFKLSDYRGKVVMLDFWGDW